MPRKKDKRVYWDKGRYTTKCPNKKDRMVYMMLEGAMTFREATKVKRLIEKHLAKTKNRTLKKALKKIDDAIYFSQRY